MMRTSAARLISVAVLLIAPSVSRAQGTPSSSMASTSLVIVDGERLPAVPGLLDSLKLGRFTVDSSVAPARRRIVVESAPGGAVFFPIDDNIQAVEVIKGPRAAVVYGAEAANGVIVVTSKHASVPRTR